MVIEILRESDIRKVEDAALKSYLEYSFERLPEDFNYYTMAKEQGYFVIVTDLEDLRGEFIELKYFQLPAIDSPLFMDGIELIETKHIDGVEVMEVLVHKDTDISISLIFRKSILDDSLVSIFSGEL